MGVYSKTISTISCQNHTYFSQLTVGLKYLFLVYGVPPEYTLNIDYQHHVKYFASSRGCKYKVAFNLLDTTCLRLVHGYSP
jgi:hypothetical protein